MKTVLFAVSGISPAILTETVWALACPGPGGGRPVVPEEVVVVTTTRGEEDVRRALLTPLESWQGQMVWERLRADVLARAGLPPAARRLQLSVRVIDLPDHATGVRRPAEDLRTRQENDEAADFIVQQLASFTAQEDVRVIASIAGGRKTMGALLYGAMSLVGRECDRVTHVLVSDPFESCREFFYPAQPVQALTARPFGQPPKEVCAADAVIELADLPFVPLKNRFAELREPRLTFAGLVRRYSRADAGLLPEPPAVRLEIGPEQTLLFVEDRPMELSGRDVLMAAFLLRRATAGLPHFRVKEQAAAELADFMQDWMRRQPFHRATPKDASLVSADDLPKFLSRLRDKLQDTGLGGAIPWLAPLNSRIGFDIRSA